METIDVVCATCIGCGMGPLDKVKFPFIVIDEAAQVIEPAVILPLGKGAVQAVLVRRPSDLVSHVENVSLLGLKRLEKA